MQRLNYKWRYQVLEPAALAKGLIEGHNVLARV